MANVPGAVAKHAIIKPACRSTHGDLGAFQEASEVLQREYLTPRTLMRVDDVAEYLGQPREWVRMALADGTIPGARKVRRRWMVEQASVDAWLDAGRPARVEPQGARYKPFPRVMTRTVDRDAA